MSPDQALKHLQALCPEIIGLLRDEFGTSILVPKRSFGLNFNVKIEWPEGVNQWPPTELQYREPKMPEDWGKEIEVSHGGKDWSTVKLGGFGEGRHKHWLSTTGIVWRYARIRVSEGESMAVPSHCPACKLQTKGCTWCSDPRPGCCMPNTPPDDDGWKPMESAPKDRKVMLKMGETEIQGCWSSRSHRWISTGSEPRSHIWDEQNQPTAWKEIE